MPNPYGTVLTQPHTAELAPPMARYRPEDLTGLQIFAECHLVHCRAQNRFTKRLEFWDRKGSKNHEASNHRCLSGAENCLLGTVAVRSWSLLETVFLTAQVQVNITQHLAFPTWQICPKKRVRCSTRKARLIRKTPHTPLRSDPSRAIRPSHWYGSCASATRFQW